MFDVSFSELLVIAVVALLVIGPEKLPKVARTIGALTGRMQRYVGQVKEEVNREFRFEELQKLQQEIKQSVESAQSNIKQQAAAIKNAIISQEEPDEAPAQAIAPKPARKSRVAKSRAVDAEISTAKDTSINTVAKKANNKTKKVEV